MQGHPPQSGPRPWAAALLSLPLPGLGHLYAGAPALGVLWTVGALVAYTVGSIAAASVVNVALATTALALTRFLYIGAAAAHAAYLAAHTPQDADTPRPRWWAYATYVVVMGAVSFLVIALLRYAVLEPYRIPSGSMVPTLHVGDTIVATKGPFADPIGHGTIIVFRYPPDPAVTYISRVMAMPGDTIELRDGDVWVNGDPVVQRPSDPIVYRDQLCEPRELPTAIESIGGIPYVVTDDTARSRWATMERIRVPEDAVFVLGDNRSRSHDSRVWGTVPWDHIMGTAKGVALSFDRCEGAVRWPRYGTSLEALQPPTR